MLSDGRTVAERTAGTPNPQKPGKRPTVQQGVFVDFDRTTKRQKCGKSPSASGTISVPQNGGRRPPSQLPDPSPVAGTDNPRRKLARHSVMAAYRESSTRTRGRYCRTKAIAPVLFQSVAYRSADRDLGGRLAVHGLETCNGAYCPVCGPARRARAATAVQAGLGASWRRDSLFITLTIRHRAGAPLWLLQLLQRTAVGMLGAGRSGAAFMETLGTRDWATTVDHTVSTLHGWHPHLHMLAFRCGGGALRAKGTERVMRRRLTAVQEALEERWPALIERAWHRLHRLASERGDRQIDELEKAFGKRHCRALRHGGCAVVLRRELRKQLERLGALSDVLPDAEHGVRVERPRSEENVANYLAKIGLELTGGGGSHSTVDGVPRYNAHGLLETIAAQGADSAAGRRSLAWFRELETAMLGRSLIRFSRGAKARLGLETERPEPETALDDSELPDGHFRRYVQDHGIVPSFIWNDWRRRFGVGWLERELDAHHRTGPAGFRAFLTALGVLGLTGPLPEWRTELDGEDAFAPEPAPSVAGRAAQEQHAENVGRAWWPAAQAVDQQRERFTREDREQQRAELALAVATLLGRTGGPVTTRATQYYATVTERAGHHEILAMATSLHEAWEQTAERATAPVDVCALLLLPESTALELRRTGKRDCTLWIRERRFLLQTVASRVYPRGAS